MPPFGFFGEQMDMMGPMPPWRDGRRGPGRGRRGDVRKAILAILKDNPMNGYQLIQEISQRSDGLWRPGPGSVYPALNLLTDEGLVQTVDGDGKQVHDLTDAGRAYVAEHADEVDAPWERVAGPHQGFLDVRQEVNAMAMALKQVVMAGDQNQIDAARKVLATARRDLYRILAEDDPAE